jgi:hypothetical protein
LETLPSEWISGANIKHCEHLDRQSDSVELFQPPIGLSESLVFRFVELFQPQEEIHGLVILIDERFGGAVPAADRS